MKKDPLSFKIPGSNAWRLVGDDSDGYSDKVANAAKEARKLLKRVVEEHPDTPWALLAGRDLENPMGFKWVEAHVPPRRRNDDDSASAKRKRETTPPKPQPPPKL